MRKIFTSRLPQPTLKSSEERAGAFGPSRAPLLPSRGDRRVSRGLILLPAVAGLVLTAQGRAADLELDHAMALWRANAPWCESEVTRFPSIRPFGAGEGACPNPSCGDGDATMLPNGMLCLAGEEAGCDGVRRAQDAKGKWHRSPRLANRPECRPDDEFSPDMGLGVQAYLIKTRDREAGQRWFDWLSAHAVCRAALGGKCLVPQAIFCEHPTGGAFGCTFRPLPIGSDYAMLAETERFVGLKAEGVFRGPIGGDLGGATKKVLVDATLNAKGFSQHLVATQIWLLRAMGPMIGNLDEAAQQLAKSEPLNPFFVYLDEGPTQRVRGLLLSECPTRPVDIERHVGETPTSPVPPPAAESAWWIERQVTDTPGPYDWFPQREASEHRWFRSSLWDCIFIGKLLGAS